MNILMLSSTFPYPPTKGGTHVRTFNLLKHLAQNHVVTLLTQRSPDITDEEVTALSKWVHELKIFQRPVSAAGGIPGKLCRFGQFLLNGTPPNVQGLHHPTVQSWLDQAVASGQFDAITCEHSVNEIFVRPQWQSQSLPHQSAPLRTVVDIHSSVYGTCKNQLETQTSEHWWRDRLNLPLLNRYERRYCQKFSQIVVTTPDDQQQIQAFNPQANIAIIPNGVDFTDFPYRTADPGGHRLIFIGAMDNNANIDAVRFFSREVFPRVRQQYPEATLDLVGSRPVPEVLELAQMPGITVTGRVPSMAEYLHRSTVCVVPMRTGFGIKNKTLEAMAAGVPVVGSDRGLEGLAVDGAGVPLRALRANHIEEYLVAISRLFTEPQLRKQISREGRSLIEQDYTWEQAGRRYEAAVLGAQ
ncbi:MAG: glycosyltransferase family 4 protein [Oculatellaceae cyanobacterium Prado106]|jgi:glycosyltransferase involved in cell wall biosynthesis|nr:glycosyltransferase family 4 protein [Oculatellaceae cyanobacterium Prado106]